MCTQEFPSVCGLKIRRSYGVQAVPLLLGKLLSHSACKGYELGNSELLGPFVGVWYLGERDAQSPWEALAQHLTALVERPFHHTGKEGKIAPKGGG